MYELLKKDGMAKEGGSIRYTERSRRRFYERRNGGGN